MCEEEIGKKITMCKVMYPDASASSVASEDVAQSTGEAEPSSPSETVEAEAESPEATIDESEASPQATSLPSIVVRQSLETCEDAVLLNPGKSCASPLMCVYTDLGNLALDKPGKGECVDIKDSLFPLDACTKTVCEKQGGEYLCEEEIGKKITRCNVMYPDAGASSVSEDVESTADAESIADAESTEDAEPSASESVDVEEESPEATVDESGAPSQPGSSVGPVPNGSVGDDCCEKGNCGINPPRPCKTGLVCVAKPTGVTSQGPVNTSFGKCLELGASAAPMPSQLPDESPPAGGDVGDSCCDLSMCGIAPLTPCKQGLVCVGKPPILPSGVINDGFFGTCQEPGTPASPVSPATPLPQVTPVSPGTPLPQVTPVSPATPPPAKSNCTATDVSIFDKARCCREEKIGCVPKDSPCFIGGLLPQPACEEGLTCVIEDLGNIAVDAPASGKCLYVGETVKKCSDDVCRVVSYGGGSAPGIPCNLNGQVVTCAAWRDPGKRKMFPMFSKAI